MLLPKVINQSSSYRTLSLYSLFNISFFSGNKSTKYQPYNNNCKQCNFISHHYLLTNNNNTTIKALFSTTNNKDNQNNKDKSKYGETIRIQTIGFKDNVVQDYNKIAYQTNRKLQFINGKCLLYRNNRTIISSVLGSLIYTGPIGTILYLLITNPFADTFPAAIPILGILEFLLLKLFSMKIQRNQNLIREIYLLENGEATEIIFNNQRKRKLFGEPSRRVYYNSIFINPDFEAEKDQSLIIKHQSTQFPTSQNVQSNAENPQNLKGNGSCWIKYYSNGENYLLIPKTAEYIDYELLSQIFEGKLIIAGKTNK